jgi:NADH:ubiquinone oxidoreductase subunit 2 (subunit N)
MLYLIELDLLFSVILIIIYTLFSLKSVYNNSGEANLRHPIKEMGSASTPVSSQAPQSAKRIESAGSVTKKGEVFSSVNGGLNRRVGGIVGSASSGYKYVTNNYVSFYLNDVYFFASLFPLLFVIGYFIDSGHIDYFFLANTVTDLSVNSHEDPSGGYADRYQNIGFLNQSFGSEFVATSDVNNFFSYIINFVLLNPIDILLAFLLMTILPSFASFESVLLLIFAFIGSYFMLHSVDLLTFYIALEAQNFCFLVLSGLGSSNVSYGLKQGNSIAQSKGFIDKYVSGGFERMSDKAEGVRSFASSNFVSSYTGEQNQSKIPGELLAKPAAQPGWTPGSQRDLGSLPHLTVMSGKDTSSFSVEVTLKYFLLSAFSSGVILFWFSTIYLQTGLSVLNFKNVILSDGTGIIGITTFFSEGTSTGHSPVLLHSYSPVNVIEPLSSMFVSNDFLNFYTFQILCAMMFKLGAAPLHLWVIQIYSSVKRSLLMYISTVPKLALFGFWVNSFHTIWTDYSIILFALFSIILGSLGAYGQPALRTLFAYSTVNEIGLMLMAIETAGFHSLFQHLSIYIISQLLLWNIYDKRFFSVLAVSLAGLPPLAGFFGKAWIFWHVSSLNLYTVLIIALFCTGVSLVYYLRVLRLFWYNSYGNYTRVIMYNSNVQSYKSHLYSHTNFINYDNRVILTSICLILLVFIPLFVIKPFVL